MMQYGATDKEKPNCNRIKANHIIDKNTKQKWIKVGRIVPKCLVAGLGDWL